MTHLATLYIRLKCMSRNQIIKCLFSQSVWALIYVPIKCITRNQILKWLFSQSVWALLCLQNVLFMYGSAICFDDVFFIALLLAAACFSGIANS
jgi:hypothetical protein